MKKSMVTLLGLMSAIACAGNGLELAGFRDWTSTDGKKLNAQLVELGPNAYTLKSRQDGRTYDIPVERISAADKNLVSAANAAIDSAKSNCQTGRSFTGFPDPSEAF